MKTKKVFKMAVALLTAATMAATGLSVQAATSAATVTASKDVQQFMEEFKNPTTVSGPSIRYWVTNASLTAEQIDSDLNSIAGAGFASIELTWVQNIDAPTYNLNDYGFGSDNWVTLLKNVLKSAKRYGLEVDLLYSNRWPANVPFQSSDYANLTNEEITQELDQDYAAKQMRYSSYVVSGEDFTQTEDGNYRFTGELPEPAGLSYGESTIKYTLHPIAYTVAKTASQQEQVEQQTNMWGNITEKTVLNNTLDESSMKDISQYDEKGEIQQNQSKWILSSEEYQEVLEGKWNIFGFYWQVTGQANKKESVIYTTVVDHYSKQGTETIIDFWNSHMDEELRQLLQEVGGDFFEDSMELAACTQENSTNFTDGSFIPWMVDTTYNTDSLEAFQQKYGYDLTTYLPMMVSSFGSSVLKDEQNREVHYGLPENDGDVIVSEYKMVMSDLMMQNHLDVMTEWAESVGMNFRTQAYITTNNNGGIDSIDAASRVGTIEGETLAFDEKNSAGGYDCFRYLSGGAHISGKQIISDEVGAIFGKYINNATFEEVLATINRNTASGANQYVLHGYPAKFEFVNTTANKWPGWAPFDESSSYSGVSEAWGERNPVWENFSILSDYMARSQLVTQTGIAKKDLVFYYDQTVIKDTFFNQDDGNILSKNGYDYEFLSPNVLDCEHAYVKDGILAPESAAYQAMLFYNQKALSLDTVEKLEQYAQNGLPLIFIGCLPTETTNYQNNEVESQQMAERINSLVQNYSNVVLVEESNLVEQLQEMDILPAADYQKESELITIHRNDQDQADYYYLYNPTEQSINLEISFQGEGTPYNLDLWTGEIEPIACYQQESGRIVTEITVESGESKVVAFSSLFPEQPELHVISGTADCYSYGEDGSILVHAAKAGNYATVLSNGQVVSTTVEQDVKNLLSETNWQLDVNSWTADKSDLTGLTTIKAQLEPVQLTSLTPWSQISGLETVSGNGVYTTTLQLENWDSQSSATLSMETAAGTVAITGVTVNGTVLPVINQQTKQIEIGGYLQSGENTICISIASGLANARMEAPTLEYGLTDVSLLAGSIQSIPMETDSSSRPSQSSSSDTSLEGTPSKSTPQTGDVYPVIPLAGVLLLGTLLVARKRRYF